MATVKEFRVLALRQRADEGIIREKNLFSGGGGGAGMDLEGGGREQRIFFTQNYLQQLQSQLTVVQDSQNFLLYLCLLYLIKTTLVNEIILK